MRKAQNSIEQWAKHMNRCFTEEDTPEANEYMKRRSTALVTKEI